MAVPLGRKSRRAHGRQRFAPRLNVEALEPRNLLSLSPGSTLLNPLPLLAGTEAVGNLGSGPSGRADVEWYTFHLDSASDVTLATHDQAEGRSLVSVLSLYNTADPYDLGNQVGDYYERLGHRELAQVSGTGQAPDASLERKLGQGDYFVAVSGVGNNYFSPLLPGSGYPGAMGDYALSLTVNDLGLSGSVPAIVAVDTASVTYPGTHHSPFVVRVDLSRDWNTDPSNYGQVQLVYGQAATPVTVNYSYSALAHELQLTPAATLKPGAYQIVISTDPTTGKGVLANPLALPLTFQVTGIEGKAVTFQPDGSPPPGLQSGDDTQATAHDLPNVTVGQLQQVAGAIGTDYIDDFTPFNMNDVNMYRFRVSGAGQYQIDAEVFAGRIGSPLNAALSLFHLDPRDGLLHLVVANADTRNAIRGADGFSTPLYFDPFLTAGLNAGDFYYLAVSSGGNVNDPVLGQSPGSYFDPNKAGSGQNGDSTGDYVLNFLITPHPDTPRVVSITRDDGIVPGGSPARFVVQFNEPVNLQQLEFQAYAETPDPGRVPGDMKAVFIQGPNGPIYPRLDLANSTPTQATFVMLQGLTNGTYHLHLSGPSGLTDLADNPLANNPLAQTDPVSPDYVFDFTVNDPARPPGGNPQLRVNQDPNTDPQNLGILFTQDLLTTVCSTGAIVGGVDVTRDFTLSPPVSAPTDTQDVYQIQVIYPGTYVFNLTGPGTPAGVYGVVTGPNGPLSPVFRENGAPGRYKLAAGTYTITIGVWQSGDAPSVTYNLHITILGSPEKPTPLTIGAAPAISIRVASTLPPPPPVTLPPPPAALPAQANSQGIPSGVLVALDAPPLGAALALVDNVARPTAQPGLGVLDRVVALAPRSLRTEEIVELLILAHTLDLTGEEDAAGVIPVADKPSTPGQWPITVWDESPDMLFRSWDLLTTVPEDLPQEFQSRSEDRGARIDLEHLAILDSQASILDLPSSISALAVVGVFAGLAINPARRSRDRRSWQTLPCSSPRTSLNPTP